MPRSADVALVLVQAQGQSLADLPTAIQVVDLVVEAYDLVGNV
jgi:flagellar hook-basal body complex protein FliE